MLWQTRRSGRGWRRQRRPLEQVGPVTGTPVREALDAAVDALAAVGVDEPRLDAELLLGEAMGCERSALIAGGGVEVPASAGRKFGEMVRRRLRREPVAYILGRKGFRHLELAGGPRGVVPPPRAPGPRGGG